MQTFKVSFSDMAKGDLQEIVAYISRKDSSTKAKYVERGILSQVKKLTVFPDGYPKDPYIDIDRQTVRFVVKWRYKILFIVDNIDALVQIVGIFHTSQNTGKLVHLID
ncbi:MAG: type II toxin-antitoxin system RelE/ParE family toxin [Bacteroidales bacterium]|jgi:plasmid stabilization system protein ParE|nr:type II toxin-antitoxin system RelE/ParE family toxin [Bacteroidales bacterium]